MLVCLHPVSRCGGG